MHVCEYVWDFATFQPSKPAYDLVELYKVTSSIYLAFYYYVVQIISVWMSNCISYSIILPIITYHCLM